MMIQDNKPRLLDLFCGAGGAAMGYHRAGFEIVGIDIKPQPHYPFPFLQMDALEAMDRLLRGEGLTFTNGETLYLVDFAALHASPPCQRYSAITQQHGRAIVESHPDLIKAVRTLFLATGKSYVIENVPKAPLINAFMLCGSMFNLKSGVYYLRRHRKFECSFDFWPPASCCHQGLSLSVYGHPGGNSCRDHRKFGNLEDWKIGMVIDWTSTDELAQAIPPAYTEYIGKYLIQAVMENK
jgi:DNA (cytosine-5)-methyltransferase 1